jgi:hypothetical protein
MIMGWCRARGVPEEAYYAWVFKGKEDTPERRARYGADWRKWDNKRLPWDFKMLLVLQALYPDVRTAKNGKFGMFQYNGDLGLAI